MDRDDEEEERGVEEEEMMEDGEGNVMYKDIREQDRFLPIANIARIMKKVLPGNAKIAKDAKESIQECVSEYISFITSEASDKCQQEKRKTINGDDLLWAMSTLGFEKYIDPLKIYLAKYRESVKGDKPDKKTSTTTTTTTAISSFSSAPANTAMAAAAVPVHNVAPPVPLFAGGSSSSSSSSSFPAHINNGAALKMVDGDSTSNNAISTGVAPVNVGMISTSISSTSSGNNYSSSSSTTGLAAKASSSSPVPLVSTTAPHQQPTPSFLSSSSVIQTPASHNTDDNAVSDNSSNDNKNIGDQNSQSNQNSSESNGAAADLNTTHVNMSGGVAVASATDGSAALPPMPDLSTYNPYDAKTGNLLMGDNLKDTPLFLGQRDASAGSGDDGSNSTNGDRGSSSDATETATQAATSGPAPVVAGDDDGSTAFSAPPKSIHEGSAEM